MTTSSSRISGPITDPPTCPVIVLTTSPGGASAAREPFCRGYFLGPAGRHRGGNGPQAQLKSSWRHRGGGQLSDRPDPVLVALDQRLAAAACRVRSVPGTGRRAGYTRSAVGIEDSYRPGRPLASKKPADTVTKVATMRYS